MPATPPVIAIVGAGPAGLRAAEIAVLAGAEVTLFDAKPSPGRKFLVAGRGGLNLTKEEPPALFASHYSFPGLATNPWPALLADFDSTAMRGWAANLGSETFTASTGRVYPRELKAAPLLRRWVRRLRHLGVRLAMHHRWSGLSQGSTGFELAFITPAGPVFASASAVILALGGGSWPQTGSDGRWTSLLEGLSVSIAPLQAANCGWECPWSAEFLAIAEGQPLKNLAVFAAGQTLSGELLVTRYGLEGGSLYELGAVLRAMDRPAISIDLKPSHSREQLIAKAASVRGDFFTRAAVAWRLSPAARALLRQHSPAAGCTIEALAALAKNLVIPLTRPRPIAEAISTAGGVRWSELDDGLMLNQLPGVFVAGEMIDWEAPTGGYLLQGCFATATRAARSALRWTSRGP